MHLSFGLVEGLFITLHCSVFLTGYAADNSTTEGVLFVLALPQMKPQPDHDIKIHFILFSDKSDVHVRFTSLWTGEDELAKAINLKQGEEQTYTAPEKYNLHTDMGNKNTFFFHGSDKFTLTAVVAQGKKSFESLRAINVLAWDTVYYAATAIGRPSIQIVTFRGPNKIRVKFRISNPETMAISFHGISYSNLDKLDITLMDKDGFSVAMCNDHNWESQGDLTGTKISGRLPLGVISGNCKVSLKQPDCTVKGRVYDLQDSNYLAEQLIPVEYYGKEFYTLTTPGRISHAEILVVASCSDTTVRIAVESDITANPSTQHLRHEGDNLRWISTCPEYLYSDKEILVVYYHGPRCHDEANAIKESGSPSMCLVVPCSLFYTEYNWSPFQTSTVSPKNYFLVVIKQKLISQLFLNDHANQSHVVDSVYIKGTEEWRVVFLKVSAVRNHINVKPATPFGCYALQMTDSVTSMHPADYIVHNYVLKCTPTLGVVPDDLIDNDCDGAVDEESLDGNDNDGDGKIDEDVGGKGAVTLFPRGTTALQAGKWTEWGPWQCTRDCEELREARRRKCSDEKRVCSGIDQEMREAECYFGKKCPEECVYPKWGANCIYTCSNCYKECDKFTGACLDCNDGFQLVDGLCDTECEHKTYGRGCNQSCEEKCEGQDCIDRITGECAGLGDDASYSLLGFIFLVPVCLTVCLCDMKRRNEKKRRKRRLQRQQFLDSQGSDVSKKSTKSKKSMKSIKSTKSLKSKKSIKSTKSSKTDMTEFPKKSKKSVASAVDPDSDVGSSDEEKSDDSSPNSTLSPY